MSISDEITLTTDLPELGLPMIYLDAARLFPNDGASRRIAIVVGLISRIGMAQDIDPEFKLSKRGERDRSRLFNAAFGKFMELGGFQFLSISLANIVESKGEFDINAKGSGSPFLPSSRPGEVLSSQGEWEKVWVVGNHSKQHEYLLRSSRVIELMIKDKLSNETALNAARLPRSRLSPSGRQEYTLRQMRSIWQNYRTVAHFQTARAFLRSNASVGETLAVAEACRAWLLGYRKRQRSSEPLFTEGDLMRAPAAWIPFIPHARLVEGRNGIEAEFTPQPALTCNKDSQVHPDARDAYIRAARSGYVNSISFPTGGRRS
jgi:hypothetical protein